MVDEHPPLEKSPNQAGGQNDGSQISTAHSADQVESDINSSDQTPVKPTQGDTSDPASTIDAIGPVSNNKIDDLERHTTDSEIVLSPADEINHGSMIDPTPESHSAGNTPLPTESTSTKEESADTSAPTLVPERPFWNPLWLRSEALAGITSAIVAVLIAIIILTAISESNHGLIRVQTSYHYLWTYFPTVVIVLISAFWHQIDYTCRLLAPWASLLEIKDPGLARQSIILDLISPSALFVMRRAWRCRAWSVIATSLGTVALGLAIVFSTSLLIPLSVDVTTSGVPVPFTSHFEGFSNRHINYDPQRSALLYLGSKTQDMPRPVGVSDRAAFFEPGLSDQWPTGDIRVNVSALAPSLECITPTWNLVLEPQDNETSWFYINFNLYSKECSITYQKNIIFDDMGEHNVVGFWDAFSGNQGYCGNGSLWSEDFIFVFGMVEEVWPDTQTHDLESLQTGSGCTVICKSHYTIEQAALTVGANKELALTLAEARLGGQLSDYNSTEFGSDVWAAVSSSFGYLPVIASPATVMTNWEMSYLLYAIGSNNYSDLLNASVVKKGSTSLVEGLGSQVAHYLLSVPSNDTLPALRTLTETRLQVRRSSAIVVAICLTMTLITMALICVIRPRNIVAHRPDSLLHQALIFCHCSASLRPRLQIDKIAAQAHRSPLDLTTDQSHFEQLTGTKSLAIISRHSPTEASPRSEKLTWWITRTAHTAFTALCIVLIVAIWIVLECLQQRSDNHSGFLTIKVTESTASALATVLPALIMLAVKTMVQDCCMNIHMFYPFGKLSKGSSRIRPLLTEHYVGQLPVVNMAQSIFNKQYLLTIVSATSLAAAFLTTITSGLYTTSQLLSPVSWQAQISDSFDIQFVDLGSAFHLSTGSEKTIFSIIDGYNATTPPLVHDELVYYNMSLTGSLPTAFTEDFKEHSLLYHLNSIPAIRASLDCTFSSPAAETFTIELDGDDTLVDFTDKLDIPESCLFSPDDLLNDTLTTWNSTSIMKNNNVGYFSEVEYFFWHALTGKYTLKHPCLTIGFVFGYLNATQQVEDVTVMHCLQRIEEVDTNTTFLVPSMSVDKTEERGPRVLDTTPRVLNESALLPTAFPLSVLSRITVDEEYSTLDSFYAHVVQGLDAVPPSELIGWNNRGRLFEATQRVYRRFMAILIHVHMRAPLTSDPTTADLRRQEQSTDIGASSYTGEILNVPSLRLVQHAGPKIALQVLLGLIVLAVLGAHLRTKDRNLLFHNPLTIAGAMSLFAGSRLASKEFFSDSAMSLTDKELVESLAGVTVRLGWRVVEDIPRPGDEDNADANAGAEDDHDGSPQHTTPGDENTTATQPDATVDEINANANPNTDENNDTIADVITPCDETAAAKEPDAAVIDAPEQRRQYRYGIDIAEMPAASV